MTAESQTESFVGTTVSDGLWVDITSSFYKFSVDLNDIKYTSIE